jgi:hypothetical protein
MLWLDPSAMFARRFERVEGGYLYYPSGKGGGKFVTPAEYETFVKDYRRWVGGRFRPGLMLWTLIGSAVAITGFAMVAGLFEDALNVLTVAAVVAVVGKLLWVYSAPYRALRRLPDATPPRSKADRARATRAMMPWPLLIFMSFVALFWFLVGIAVLIDGRTPSFGIVVWTLVWAAVLVSLGRTAVQKYQDRRR